MKALRLLPTILFACAACTAAAAIGITGAEVEDILSRLDDSLPRRNEFIARRQNSICELQREFYANPATRVKTLHEIIDRYSSFNNDSAMYYAWLGVRIADGDSALPFRLRATALKPLAGFYESAMDDFATFDSVSIPPEYKADYYDAGRQMYSFVYGLFPSYRGFNDSIGRQLLQMQLRLLDKLPEGSVARRFSTGEYYMLTGEYDKAKAYCLELMDGSDSTERTYYLAVSALADLTGGTLEVKSLQELGSMMFERGDVDRAYSYLSMALENAVECGASMRMVETARSMPIIEQAHSGQIASWQRMIYVVIAIMVLLLAGMATLLILLRREMNNMALLQQNLRSANKIKEVYISQFMSLCSIYMDKLNSFSKIVSRKLAVGKVDDLYRLTNSGKFVEEQSNEFYDVFDNAFLHIYPDFVRQVNSLLRPDSQIVLKDGEQLNTELRILAFVRLGIQDSPRIAQVLNYSLNTIYSYRNRVKNKAVDRENFERDVMNLSSL